MSSENAIVRGQGSLPVSEETTLALVELQNKELDVRIQELEQRKIEDQHSFEYAKQTLEAQKADRSEERIHQEQRLTKMYIFWGTVLLVMLAFFAYALWIGAGELVGNIMEKVIYYIAGAVSSYGYCKYKNRQ